MDCINPVLVNLDFKLSKNLYKFKPARRGLFKRKDKVIFSELSNMAAYICFHVTEHVVPLNLICNMTFVSHWYPGSGMVLNCIDS